MLLGFLRLFYMHLICGRIVGFPLDIYYYSRSTSLHELRCLALLLVLVVFFSFYMRANECPHRLGNPFRVIDAVQQKFPCMVKACLNTIVASIFLLLFLLNMRVSLHFCFSYYHKAGLSFQIFFWNENRENLCWRFTVGSFDFLLLVILALSLSDCTAGCLSLKGLVDQTLQSLAYQQQRRSLHLPDRFINFKSDQFALNFQTCTILKLNSWIVLSAILLINVGIIYSDLVPITNHTVCQ